MDATTALPLHKVLANETRRHILRLLRERDRTTGDLCDAFDLSRFAVMQHLRVLEEAGLIEAEKRGRQRWNRIRREHLPVLRQAWELETGHVTDGAPAAHGFDAGIRLAAAPSAVFQALLTGADRWWTAPRDAATTAVVLEPFVGGRLLEQHGDGDGGTLLAHVTHLRRDAALHLVGTLGVARPLLSYVAVTLTPVADQTAVTVRHELSGTPTGADRERLAALWPSVLENGLPPLLATADDAPSGA